MAETLTLNQIYEHFPAQWVLIADPEFDETGEISRGRVMCHGTRDEMDAMDAKLDLESAAYVFTGPIPERTVLIF